MRTRWTVFSLWVGFSMLGWAAAAAESAPEPRSAYLDLADGARLHYLEVGQGPAILFVPGWTMPAEIWEPQLRHFARKHRVIALDPRSQGRSSKTGDGSYPAARARDLEAVLRQLQLSPALLVCWSMAVNECVTYTGIAGTGQLRGLVLVDGTAGPPSAEGNLLRFLRYLLLEWQKDRRRTFTEELVRSMYRTPQSEEYIRRITEASLQTPMDTATVLALSEMVEDSSPYLARIDKPVLIVAAGGRQVESYRQLQSRIPGSRLEVFEEAGHALFVDQAEKFNRLLEEFDRTVSRPTATPEEGDLR